MVEGVPLLFQSINVLWNVQGEGQVWWKADVVEIAFNADGSVLGTGTLQYVERKGFASCLAEVEFLRRNLLREKADRRQKGKRPSVSWRLNLEDGGSSAEGSSLSDEYSIPHTGQGKRAKPSRRTSVDHRPGKRHHSTCTHDCKPALQTQQALAALDVKVRTLQDHHADHANEVKMLRNSLEAKADRRRVSAYSSQHLATKRLLLFRLLEQLNKAPRRYRREELPGSDDCLGVQVLRVTVDCDFHLFRDIAADVRAIGGKSGRNSVPEFYPVFSETQSDLLASSHFYIVIDTLPTLCQFLHVSEMSDRKAMMHRYMSVKGESVGRLSGSYITVGSDACLHPSVYFFPGISTGGPKGDGDDGSEENRGCHACGFKWNPSVLVENEGDGGIQKELQDTEEYSNSLTRQSSMWNTDDQSYESPLRLSKTNTTPVGDPRSLSVPAHPKHAIQLVWKRCSPSVQRRWVSLKHGDDIPIGTLELLFPTIVVTGEEQCEAFRSMLSDENTLPLLSD